MVTRATAGHGSAARVRFQGRTADPPRLTSHHARIHDRPLRTDARAESPSSVEADAAGDRMSEGLPERITRVGRSETERSGVTPEHAEVSA